MNPLAHGYIDAASQAYALTAKNQAIDRLRKLGLRLHFPHIPSGWIPAIHPTDLTAAWEEAGWQANGVRYATIGGLAQDRRTSTRFWPTSPYYQAWFGGYLFQKPDMITLPGEQGALDIDAMLQCALIDQRAWLRKYGCSAPKVAIAPGSFSILQETHHHDFPAWLTEGVIQSNSDVGKGNRNAQSYLAYRTYERMFQRFGGVALPALCTLPPVWPLASYHEMALDCVGTLIQIGQNGHWALLYICAARWAGRSYLGELREEGQHALQQVRIVCG